MKKISFFVIALISLFVCINTVEAECSYADLYEEKLRASEIKVDYKEVEIEKFDENMSPPNFMEYSLYVRLFNVPDDVNIKVSSLNNSFSTFNLTSKNKNDDGIIYIIDGKVTNPNYNQIKRYQFEYYSSSGKCYGELIGSATLQTPMFNKFSLDNICDIDVDFKYCARYLNYDISKLTYKDVNEAYQKYLKDKEAKEDVKEENSIIKNLKRYWYIIIIIPAILIIGFIVYLIIRWKRGRIV